MKIKKILISLSTPIIASISLMPLVSCGQQKEVKPTDDTEDVNLGKYEISKIYLNKGFTIKLTEPKNWYKGFNITSKITIGNTTVPYQLSDDKLTLTVNGSYVNNENISINLKALPTFHNIQCEINTNLFQTRVPVYHPGQTIKATTGASDVRNFHVWKLYGKYNEEETEETHWELLTPGKTDPAKQYLVQKNEVGTGKYNDITTTFATSGYTFTDSDVKTVSGGKKRATQHILKLIYNNSTSTSVEYSDDQFMCICSLPILESEMTATAVKSTIAPNESTEIEVTTIDGTYPDFYYVLDKDSELKENQISVNSETGAVQATSATGTATINVYALEDLSFHKTVTITVSNS